MTYAQYTNFGGILDVLRRKSEILARHCRDLETDFDAITRSSNDNVLVGETQSAGMTYAICCFPAIATTRTGWSCSNAW